MSIPIIDVIHIGIRILALAHNVLEAGREVSEEELNEAVGWRRDANATWEKSKADAEARRKATQAKKE